MMKMEIEIDEEKIIENNEYSVKEVYEKINDIAKNAGITKREKCGLFVGNDDEKDFAHFGIIILDLKNEEWFMLYVKKWIWYVEGEAEDILEHYRQKRVAV